MARQMKPRFDRHKDGWLVGAKDSASDYIGPVADVAYDDTWLHIVTDPYEGHVMLNIEALPALMRALREIAKSRKARPSPTETQP